MVATQEFEVVISGIGGLFPKSNNVEDFQQLLFNNEEMVGKGRPTSDPDVTYGFVTGTERFDTVFFGIHRLFGENMDMLFRKSLENTYEAIVDAGISPPTLQRKKIAVIMSATYTDNENTIYDDVEKGAALVTQARAMLANRISYWLNATGPSYSIYNNWIGGMSSLEDAYYLIKSGQCEGVIIGALNTAGQGGANHVFTQLGFASRDGKTRPFDEDAEGYIRSDTMLVLFLQRADLARRRYATIVNVETIFSGQNNDTYTKINIDSARDFLTNFYNKTKVDPGTVQYVEAYGSALKFIDTIELNVLDKVFNNSSRKEPLLIGSVKSNMGHAEAASVLVSVVKTILAMEKSIIPANLNYKRKNEKVPALHNGKLKVVTENTPWPATLAAVNGYGLVSSFGHILLRSNAQPMKIDTTSEKLSHLYICSTRTEQGIHEIVEKIQSYETLNKDYMNLINNVFINNIPGHLFRGCVVRDYENKMSEETSSYSGDQRAVWFVYSGMGSQWITMGKDLMRLPIFATAVHKCHAALVPHGLNLLKIICSDEDPDVFNNILHSFVGIAAIQIGLTDVLHALGIQPDNIIGHSVGELGCAYADGCLTAEQMILSAYYRGRASQEVELIPGLMAAVGMGADKIKFLIPATVDIACRNGPESCTLSGPAEDMEELVSRLQGSQIFARAVNVAGIAYHSRYIKPAAPLLFEYLKKIVTKPKLRSAKWLCSSVPEDGGGWNTEKAQYASAEYFTNNLLNCVHFEPLLKYIPSNAIVIEIAPHGLLQAILKRSIALTCDNIALTRRGESKGTDFLLKSIGKLYLAGLQLNIPVLYEDSANKSDVITPCSRGTPSLAPLVKWNHVDLYEKGFYSILRDDINEQMFSMTTNSAYFRHLNGHRIYDIEEDATKEGTITVPLTAYLPLVASNHNDNNEADYMIFEDVQLYRHRVIPDQINSYNPPVTIMTLVGTNYFEINDRYGTVASGRCILPTERQMLAQHKIIKSDFGQKIDELSSDELYREFTNRGHNFERVFRAIHKLEIYEKGMIANIEWKSEWHSFVANMLQMIIFQHGRFLCRPVDTVFIRSLSCTLANENIPKQGSVIEVFYDYTTDVMSCSAITIRGPRCQPCRIESDAFIAHKCFPVAQQKNFADLNDEHKITVINIKEAAVNITDLNSNLPWIKQLNEKLNDRNFECIYLISRELPTNGIDSFLTNLQALPNGNRLRLIIILDANAPEFKSINDRFYQPAFKQQESNVSVYCAGVWEYRYTISTKLSSKHTDQYNISSIISEKNIKRYLPDVNVQFVGINTVSMDPTLSNISVENQLSIIDYAGLENKTNQPVMGLATINNKKQLSSDTILRWPLPKQWSLADGATIPYAYCIAYYALFECVAIDHTQSILIHNGYSSIGQAMIRIAHSVGCNVYTTVANEKQRVSLLKTMKMLKSSSVYDFTTNNFELKIMEATCGEGIHVLVNCLPGDSLRAGLRCVSTLGRVVLLLDENRLEKQYDEYIGLSVFFRCFGMYPIRTTAILDLSEESKKNLYTHILNGIRKNHVVPLNKSVFREKGTHQLSNITKYLSDPSVTGTAVVPIEELAQNKLLKNIQNPNQVHKVDSTYIIYGGDNVDNIISLTQWLVTSYGIKNIVILSSYSSNTNDKKYMERNLTAIKTEQKGVTIKLLDVAANKPDLVLQQIVQQKITNIGGILILSNENIQSAYLFIKKIQTKFSTIHTVLLSSVSNGNRLNLERYHEQNIKNVSFLRWDKKLRLPSVLDTLTTALEEVVDIFVQDKNILATRTVSVKTIFTFQDFCNFLSSSASSILKYSPINTDVSVEQMITRNTKHTTDLSPLFIVPGLLGSKCTYLQSTIKNLLNPAYVLDVAYGTSSLDKLTVRAGEQIRKIFPSGPYNLIGASTGGPLAIELAKHLETDHGATVQLYLLDAVPDTIKYLLSPSGDESNFENSFLKQLLNINDSKLLASLSTLPTWNAKIDAILRQSSSETKQMKLVLQALKVRRDAAVSYSPNKRNFNGVTHVIIPKQTSGESSKIMDEHKQVNVKLINGNHFTMLQERSLVEYIHEHIIHPAFFN